LYVQFDRPEERFALAWGLAHVGEFLLDFGFNVNFTITLIVGSRSTSFCGQLISVE
jgi:hypothetical protein